MYVNLCILQKLYVVDDEIGTSFLPLRTLIDKQPWGKQYNVSLGSGQGSAVLTFHLHMFSYPDNLSLPLVTPLEVLEKRFGAEIRLPNHIHPPCSIIGILQVTNLCHGSYSLSLLLPLREM